MRRNAGTGGGYARDATFCSARGRFGVGDLSLAAYNVSRHYVRHLGGSIWLAGAGGPAAWDVSNAFDDGATWHLAAPWVP